MGKYLYWSELGDEVVKSTSETFQQAGSSSAKAGVPCFRHRAPEVFHWWLGGMHICTHSRMAGSSIQMTWHWESWSAAFFPPIENGLGPSALSRVIIVFYNRLTVINVIYCLDSMTLSDCTFITHGWPSFWTKIELAIWNTAFWTQPGGGEKQH